eukprot:TRINITY_DN70149_c0_g1_i1.p1 TRINITY_DN70149_c0_g1~~TRINITY_DN70149_c0_g1_i1.p1  ORF type:complete len:623 (+),score=134.67 TRINITY_DN70149_c0_g1_i1:82-1869(+)
MGCCVSAGGGQGSDTCSVHSQQALPAAAPDSPKSPASLLPQSAAGAQPTGESRPRRTRAISFADAAGRLARRDSQVRRVLSTLRRGSELRGGPAAPLPQFKTHGEYTVTRVLREGSTAEVYVAEDKAGTEWVLKRFRGDSTENDTVWQDYLLQKVVGAHPKIVSIEKDALESEHHVCLVLEYVRDWERHWREGDVIGVAIDYSKRVALIGCNGDWQPPHGVCFRPPVLPTIRGGPLLPLLPVVRGGHGVRVRVNLEAPEAYGEGLRFPLPPAWAGGLAGAPRGPGGAAQVARGPSAVEEDGAVTLGCATDSPEDGLSDLVGGQACTGGRYIYEVTVLKAPASASLAVGWGTGDIAEDPGECYLCDGLWNMKHAPEGVSNFLLGTDVDDLIQCGPLPVARARCWYRDLMEALAHCHDHGIAHRDVKGQNLFVCCSTGVAKLGDFGAGAKDAGVKQCKEACGTPGRMAPEVWRAEAEDGAGYWAFPADVWSSGVLLWEMLTGEGLIVQPWEHLASERDLEKAAKATLAFNIGSLPAAARERLQQLPAEARSLLPRLLDPDPAKRPTARQVLDAPWVREAPPHEPFCDEMSNARALTA